jgi:serine/threonine-protein kinase
MNGSFDTSQPLSDPWLRRGFTRSAPKAFPRPASARYKWPVEFAYVDEDKEQAQARIGQVVGSGYRLTRLLGTGGMAAVFAAQSPAGQEVALKVLHDHMHRRLEIRRRFLREGETANRIAHPGIVRIIEQSKEGDREAFLVMELLQGQSLLSAIRSGAIGTSGVLDVLDQVLDALSVAHALGIIHRDLKPDNLWLTPEGRVKVLDFGIARVLDGVPKDQRTKTGITLGTVPFMSPEQALGKPEGVDARTDLFALGALAFRILAGRPVHEADTDAGMLVAMATQPAPPLCSVAPEVPKEVGEVIDRALAFYKEERYPDARVMQADVRALRAGRAPNALSAVAGSAAEAKTRVDGERPASSRLATAVTPAPDAPTRVEASAAAGLAAPVGADPHSTRTVLAPGPDAATLVTGPAAAASPTPLGANTAANPVTPERSSKKLVWVVASASLLAGVGLTVELALARSDEQPAAEPVLVHSAVAGAGATNPSAGVTPPDVPSQLGQRAPSSGASSVKKSTTTAPAKTAALIGTSTQTRGVAPTSAPTSAPPSPARALVAPAPSAAPRAPKNPKAHGKGKPTRH